MLIVREVNFSCSRVQFPSIAVSYAACTPFLFVTMKGICLWGDRHTVGNINSHTAETHTMHAGAHCVSRSCTLFFSAPCVAFAPSVLDLRRLSAHVKESQGFYETLDQNKTYGGVVSLISLV
jgi:hypothetical protein